MIDIDIDDLDSIIEDNNKSEIKELVNKITIQSQKYHANGTSDVSDAVWDGWMDRLAIIDPENELITQTGNGYDIDDEEDSSELVKVDHPIVVGSIPKEKDPKVIKTKIGPKSTFSIKLDGNSIVAYYNYGKLDKVLTRGKNNRGIDRTDKFKNIIKDQIFCALPETAVRGEAVISKKNYTVENGFDITKSSRNAVAGLISRKEGGEDQLKFVDFVAYTFINVQTKKSIYSDYDWSTDFKVEKQKPCKIFMEMDLEEFFLEYKLNHEYDADGTVFQFDDGSLVALKYKDESVITDLKGIQWTIAIDQRLTPVATLEPVKLAGATISRASLGSYDRTMSLNLWPFPLDAKVEIIRANEIIPYVTRCVSRTLATDYLTNPYCPCCATESVIEGKHAYCRNPKCPNIEQSALLKFCSFYYPDKMSDKQMLKILDGLNIKTIIQLLEFNTKRVDFTKIDGIGKSLAHLAEVFFDSISGNIDSKVIYQSVITSCGKSYANTIVKTGIKIQDIYEHDCWVAELSILSGFNRNVIKQLIEKKETIRKICSLRTVVDDKPKNVVGTYCVTGIRFSKEQVDKLLIAGWMEDSSAKKTTTVVVTNDKYGSSTKIEKAKKYGIPVLEVNEFFEDYIDED